MRNPDVTKIPCMDSTGSDRCTVRRHNEEAHQARSVTCEWQHSVCCSHTHGTPLCRALCAELEQPDYSGNVTVPVLYDKQLKRIVNNESSEIIHMINSSGRHAQHRRRA